jgi:hypothetical protein
MARVLELVSVLVLQEVDGAVLAVSPVFVREDTLTLAVLDGLRVSWIVSGLVHRRYSRGGVV